MFFAHSRKRYAAFDRVPNSEMQSPPSPQGGAGREKALRPEQLTAGGPCTQTEDDAEGRAVYAKAAAACLLRDRIGEEFDGIVTGASPKERGPHVRTARRGSRRSEREGRRPSEGEALRADPDAASSILLASARAGNRVECRGISPSRSRTLDLTHILWAIELGEPASSRGRGSAYFLLDPTEEMTPSRSRWNGICGGVPGSLTE